jgi:hypothetical protein
MTITAALLWFRANWGWLRYVLAGVGVLLALWWLVSALVDHGRSLERAEWEARQRAAEAKAQADSWNLVGDINAIDVSLSADFAETQKTRTIYRDRIRTVAVDRYVDRDCDLPASVWNDLNAVRAATARPFTGADQ